MNSGGFFVDEKSKREILDTLEKLPKNLRRNGMTSALTAGARVVRDKARMKAPSCIKGTIKTVRRKQVNGVIFTSVVAGGSRRAEGSLGNEILKLRKTLNKTVLGSASTKRKKRIIEEDMCGSAFWYEFGTYQKRNLALNPYSPQTFKRHEDYRALGHTSSWFWYHRYRYDTNGGIKQDMWMPATPFMRPAINEGHASGAINKAMVKKLREYFAKLRTKGQL